jgi:hypothetical protein
VLTDYVLDRPSERPESPPPLGAGRVVIPVTVDDLQANGLLEARPGLCWERSPETLTARKADVRGLGVATDEGIEAFVIHTDAGEVLTLGSLVDDGGGCLAHLLSIAGRHGPPAFTFAKADPQGPEVKWLGSLGFQPAGEWLVFGARAMSA